MLIYGKCFLNFVIEKKTHTHTHFIFLTLYIYILSCENLSFFSKKCTRTCNTILVKKKTLRMSKFYEQIYHTCIYITYIKKHSYKYIYVVFSDTKCNASDKLPFYIFLFS